VTSAARADQKCRTARRCHRRVARVEPGA